MSLFNTVFTHLLVLIMTVLATSYTPARSQSVQERRIMSCRIDPKKLDVRMYYQDDRHVTFGSLGHLKNWLGKRRKELVFAMNGGMYRADQSPVGLYIEKGKVVSPLDTLPGEGNFYLKPNGVFYLTADKTVHICSTPVFHRDSSIQYATQSGPLLVMDGQLHPAFQKASANLNIRNGVGILSDGSVLFAMSAIPVNFYEFAMFFKDMGCNQALYLDGLVSRMYFPARNWKQLDGKFGVMIGVVK